MFFIRCLFLSCRLVLVQYNIRYALFAVAVAHLLFVFRAVLFLFTSLSLQLFAGGCIQGQAVVLYNMVMVMEIDT